MIIHHHYHDSAAAAAAVRLSIVSLFLFHPLLLLVLLLAGAAAAVSAKQAGERASERAVSRGDHEVEQLRRRPLPPFVGLSVSLSTACLNCSQIGTCCQFSVLGSQCTSLLYDAINVQH